ncbi:M24 family metallopeptidase [Massilia sp. CCM 8695]|uniref:M24 family metallopeptidase n=1 Tax=Massilia frigida TaxID=2609281 RepID=A0ABX0NHF7_9BURK|nr:M24 family metallopeptidase [Massilia frigida]NHZ80305.1 M24 family metallopeptidase [Massilia frigida]
MPLFTVIHPTVPNPPAVNDRITLLARAHSKLLAVLLDAVRPGMATADLADVAREQAATLGIGLSFRTKMGFPDDISACINTQAMNSVPNRNTLIKDGDIVKIAFGSTDGGGAFCVQNWSMQAGTILPARRALLNDARDSLDDALAYCRPGIKVSELAARLARSAAEKGFWLSTEFAGHMIGQEPVMPPSIVQPKGLFATGHALTEGTVLSLFVLAHAARPRLDRRDDGWTVVDRKHGMSAAYSHMVRVAALPQLLTSPYRLHA